MAHGGYRGAVIPFIYFSGAPYGFVRCTGGRSAPLERFRNLSAMNPGQYVFRDNEVGGYRIFGGCLHAESGCAHDIQI